MLATSTVPIAGTPGGGDEVSVQYDRKSYAKSSRRCLTDARPRRSHVQPGRSVDEPGDAPPVLLVHGFGSDGGTDWVDTGIAVAHRRLPDRRRPGPARPRRGPVPSASAEVTALTLAEDLVAVMDRAGAATFDVAGYSSAPGSPGSCRRPLRAGWDAPCWAGSAPSSRSPPWTSTRCTAASGTAPSATTVHRRDRRHGRGPWRPRAGARAVRRGAARDPFAGGPWNAKVLPVFVVGENDELTRGIRGSLAEELGGARLVTVPGAHHEVPGGPRSVRPSWTRCRGDRAWRTRPGVRAEDEENRVSAAKKQDRTKESKAEFCYELLRSRILAYTYVPGYRLVINQLAQETGVSTIPGARGAGHSPTGWSRWCATSAPASRCSTPSRWSTPCRSSPGWRATPPRSPRRP